jgi:hypothetical protein
MCKFTKSPNTKKAKADEPKGPLPPCPRREIIDVVQFQFFDNGEPKKTEPVISEDGKKKRPGAGRSRYTMKVEVYCEGKFNIYKPYWKRTAALLNPDQVKKWADEQLSSGKMSEKDHEFYATLYTMAETFIEDPDAHWVKIGYIEDRSSKVRYPGQAVFVTKRMSGPMDAALFTNGVDEKPLCPDAMIFDKFSKPDAGRRLFYGFYDPNDIYEKTKARAAKEAEVLSRRPVPTVEPNQFGDFMSRSPF